MAKTISLPAEPSLDDVLRSWDELELEGEPAERVIFHMGSLRMVTAAVLAVLTDLVHFAAAQFLTVELVCPWEEEGHRLLTMIGFYDGLPANVAPSRTEARVPRGEPGRSVVELTRLRHNGEAAPLGDRVHAATLAQGQSGEVARAVATAMSEASSNVLEHADSPTGALVAAHSHPRTGLELAIFDSGRGILRSLADNPELDVDTELEAVRLALQPEVSRLPDSGRGTGLPDIVRRAKAAGAATLQITSGHARALLYHGAKGEWRQEIYLSPIPTRGTLVALRLRG
jgi:anti-sigma regulatory factor (Ser/Thr protein kinase)